MLVAAMAHAAHAAPPTHIRPDVSCRSTTHAMAVSHAHVVRGSRKRMSRAGPSRIVTLAAALTTSTATIAAIATRNGVTQRVIQPIDATSPATTTMTKIHGHGDGPGTHTMRPDTNDDVEPAPRSSI